MNRSLTIIGTWFHTLVDQLVALGIDRARLTEGIITPETRVGAPIGQFEIAVVRRLWHRAAALGGDPLLGLKAGATLPFQAMNVLALVVLHSPNVEAALHHIERYQHLISDNGHFCVIKHGDGCRIVYRLKASPVQAHSMQVDSVLAGKLTLLRRCGLSGVTPARVTLLSRESDGDADYASFFGCPVEFSTTQAEMHYDRTCLALAFPCADASLLTLACNHAEGMLRARSELTSLAASVRAAALASGFVNASCNEMAAQLGMSSRTLQRRLGEAGINFRQLIESTRMDEALYLLTQTASLVSEIGKRLGYSEPSAFSHAVRNCWGKTPRDLRMHAATP